MTSLASPSATEYSTFINTPTKRRIDEPPVSTPLTLRTAAAAAAVIASPSVERRLDFDDADGDESMRETATTPDAPAVSGSPAKRLKASPIPLSPNTPQPTATPEEAYQHTAARIATMTSPILPSAEGFSEYGTRSASKAPPPAPRAIKTRAKVAVAIPTIRDFGIPAPTPQELAARAAAEQKAAVEKAVREAVTAKATALLAKKEIAVGSQRYTLTRCLGKGDFMETWATNVPGKVVKRFHHECIRERRGDVLQLLLCEGAQNFRDLKTLGIPLADIHNLDTMESDMVVVQDLVQNFGKEEKLSEEVLSVIQKCLKICYEQDAKKRLAADMSKANFGLNKEGKVVFLDVVGIQTAFHIGLTQYLKSFSQGNQEIYEFLNPNPELSGKK